MEYLVLLPNKIVALLWYFIMMEKWWPMKEHITATSFEMKIVKFYFFVKIKINGILRRCPYFLIIRV
jgi:hypothetical protein